MLTAKEARSLAKVPDEDTINEALAVAADSIKVAASAGKRKASLHHHFWVNEGYGQSPNYKAACNSLVALGYKVEFFYEERQFVDMYTIVSW